MPSDGESTVLKDFITNDGYVGTEGNTLKEVGYEHWWDYGSPDYEGLDVYDFTALPGGSRSNDDGYYGNMGRRSYFWTSINSSSDDAWGWELNFNNPDIYRLNFSKENGFSVRCLKD